MEILQELGSYAGFAAVVGLAVLAALYFSQARDVKRLREWAGRAPERTAEQETRARATTTEPSAARPPGAAAAAPAVPAAPATAASASEGSEAASPLPPLSASAPPISASASPPSQTRILPPKSRIRTAPWYRRVHWPAPRYLVLIVAGIAIFGTGAGYAVFQLIQGDEQPKVADGSAAGKGGQPARRRAPLDPSKVTVSVLNGTTIPGLAATVSDKLDSAGFQRGNVATATESPERAESVILYANGAAREARAVARRLKISQIEPIDPESQALAGDATVVVTVGADQTQ